MRDVTAAQRDRMNGLASATTAYFEQQGYQAVHTPLLEQTELFVRKSGGDLVNSLYTFQDPGGNTVSLRPEFTSSVIRHYVEVADTLCGPVRWQYGGPVFRYESDGAEGSLREFTQLGAELVGGSGVEADAEIIHLAWSGLARAGLTRCTLRIGHLGAVNALLAEHDLSDAAKLFIVGNLRPLKEGETDVEELKRRAQGAGLLREQAEDGIGEAGSMDLRAAQELVRRVVAEPGASRMGQRTPEEIASRLLRKMRRAHDPAVFEAALEMVDELARVEGPPGPALESLRAAAGGAAVRCGAFDDLSRLLDALADRGVPEDALSLDVGLARGIAYYTGAIFEMYAAPEVGPSLGGGGRYDGLVRALGGAGDVPAMGFAYNVESVLEALTAADKAAVAQ
jgi:histidyl-tRNA synthetase